MKFICLLLFLYSFAHHGQTQSLVFVFLNSKSDKAALSKAEGEKIMAGHMANIARLAKEGKLISAGPFDGGGGIFIFKADSIAQAREWLQTDPGVKANRWNIEMFRYAPHVGSACAVSEPYEMVTYDFIRYTLKQAMYNGKDSAETAMNHERHLALIGQSGNVVAEGTLERNGGILVMRGDLQKDAVEADPGVAEGLYQIEYKKLYIAKGAFCEK